MKRILVFILVLVLSALNVIAAFFWCDDLYYLLSERHFEEKYSLPNGLRLDYWGYEFSKENYGVVITDLAGGLVIHKNIPLNGGTSVSELYGYLVQNGSLIVTVIRDNRDTVNIKVDKDHSLRMLADRSLSEAPNYVVLDDRKLRNWLEYKNSFHPNFFLFSIILALSIILDFLMIKNILG